MPLKFERPSSVYMRELEEVARDADSLADFIAKANLLPNDFPAEAISVLCVGLASLPLGTAEGSIGILTHAESRLKSWRYAFLKHAQVEGELPQNETDEPIPRRGERLDDALKELLASVGTAIECYKLEAGEDIETDTAPENDLLIDIDFGREEALDSVDAMGKTALDLRDQITRAYAPNDDALDTPKRILTDVDNQAKAGRSELLLPLPRPKYLDKLRLMGAASWQAIERASGPGKSVGSVIGFGGLAAGSAELIVLGGAITAASHIVSLVAIALQHGQSKEKDLKEKQRSQVKPRPFDLDEVHAMILRREAPPKDWVPMITELSFSDKEELTDVSPMLGLFALRSLNLSGTRVTGLSPLIGLGGLASLDIVGTHVADLSPLRQLEGLRRLALSGFQVSNVSPLSALLGLESLFLMQTKVVDISPLRNLNKLRILALDRSDVSDLSPLSGLTRLETLSLTGTRVVDISPLSEMTSLRSLHLNQSRVEDLGPLRGLVELEELNLTGTQVANLWPISTVATLRKLYLGQTQVFDVLPLSQLTRLTVLDLTETLVSNIQPLKGLFRLQNLYLDGTQVSSLRPLDFLTSEGLKITWNRPQPRSAR
jgi:Leucine-rich repeat (LRR) protein